MPTPEAKVRYTDDVPEVIEARVRALCAALPEVVEQPAWRGVRWRVRTKTFAHVLGVVRPGAPPEVVLAFRSAGEEREALAHAGPPLLVLGWGRDAMGVTLDERTDWHEIRELVTESYRLLAPKKLVAALDAAEVSPAARARRRPS